MQSPSYYPWAVYVNKFAMEAPFDLDWIIEAVYNRRHVTEPQVISLMHALQEVLFNEPSCLDLPGPVTVCGDIHGQLFDVFQLFEVSGEMSDDPSITYLFMGDYVDRGAYSLETFVLLAALKLRYPSRMFLLRGNHESRGQNQGYGFYDNCINIYGHAGVWGLCNETFNLLPLAAVVNKQVFCVHGGLSKNIRLIEEIELMRRNTAIPTEGPMTDFCWSDPGEVADWTVNRRGAGWVFNGTHVREFCHRNGLEVVARSHQVAMEGVEWFFNKSLVTVWSAPKYMGRFQNKACVMKVSSEGELDFVMFDGHVGSTAPEEIVVGYFA